MLNEDIAAKGPLDAVKYVYEETFTKVEIISMENTAFPRSTIQTSFNYIVSKAKRIGGIKRYLLKM